MASPMPCDLDLRPFQGAAIYIYAQSSSYILHLRSAPGATFYAYVQPRVLRSTATFSPGCYVLHLRSSPSATFYIYAQPQVLRFTSTLIPKCYVLHLRPTPSALFYIYAQPQLLQSTSTLIPKCYVLHLPERKRVHTKLAVEKSAPICTSPTALRCALRYIMNSQSSKGRDTRA